LVKRQSKIGSMHRVLTGKEGRSMTQKEGLEEKPLTWGGVPINNHIGQAPKKGRKIEGKGFRLKEEFQKKKFPALKNSS